MATTMINFLTNERVPRHLQLAIEKIKRDTSEGPLFLYRNRKAFVKRVFKRASKKLLAECLLLDDAPGEISGSPARS
ncbi:MAG: hypothetical protein QM640_05430 [Niabella sp.]